MSVLRVIILNKESLHEVLLGGLVIFLAEYLLVEGFHHAMESLRVLNPKLSQQVLNVSRVYSTASVSCESQGGQHGESPKLMRVGKTDVIRVPNNVHSNEDLQSNSSEHQVERLPSHRGQVLQGIHL